MIEKGKINILMVMANTRMGGVQAFVLNVLHNINLDKFHIDFAINFYAECNGIEDECRRLGCDFHILPYFNSSLKFEIMAKQLYVASQRVL